MAYTPDNNPYIPGDPYSYDLKWQVDNIKHMQTRFGELDDQVQEATDQADRAEQEADRAAGRADFATEEADRATAEADRAAGRADFATTEANRATTEANRAESEADRSKDYADHIADPVAGLVANWLAEHVDPATGYVVDDTLTIANAAADALATGNLIRNLAKNNAYDIVSLSDNNTQAITTDNLAVIGNDLVFPTGKKYFISAKINTNNPMDYYLCAVKPNLSGYVNSNILKKSVAANTDVIFNAVYEPSKDCKLGFRYTGTITATMEMYVYDISTFSHYPSADILYKNGISDLTLFSEGSKQANISELLALPQPVFTGRVIGSAADSYWPIGFTDWDHSNKYLFIITGSLAGTAPNRPIGFLTSSFTWAERYYYTAKFDDGGGYVIATPPAAAADYFSPQLIGNNTVDVDANVLVFDVTDYEYNALEIEILRRYYSTGISALELANMIVDYVAETTIESKLDNSWLNKNVLFIGDSLTAANDYQQTVKEKLGITYTNHAAGGYGIINIIDGYGSLPALSVADVTGKDLIVFYAGYNNRGSLVGNIGDLYPAQHTIAGYMQYAINKIYELLASASNLTCKILIVTVDCAGKYPWIDADGYTEYPAGSGQTMETIANIQKAVADYNSLPCLDLWHHSGINRNTWTVFGKDPTATVVTPTEPDAPYPYNGDQLHKSPAGYKRIGECIAGKIIESYSN